MGGGFIKCAYHGEVLSTIAKMLADKFIDPAIRKDKFTETFERVKEADIAKQIDLSNVDGEAFVKWFTEHYQNLEANPRIYDFDDYAVTVLGFSKIGTLTGDKNGYDTHISIETAAKRPYKKYDKYVRANYAISHKDAYYFNGKDKQFELDPQTPRDRREEYEHRLLLAYETGRKSLEPPCEEDELERY